jgi:hypothetical protein
MVEMQILHNRNGYHKQYVVTDQDVVVAIITDMFMAKKLEKEIQEKNKENDTIRSLR